MAAIQERNGSFRLIHRHRGKQRSLGLGRVGRGEAEAKAGAVDLVLLRLRQGLLRLPDGVSLDAFLLSEGKAGPPPAGATRAGPGTPPQPQEALLPAPAGGAEEGNAPSSAR